MNNWRHYFAPFYLFLVIGCLFFTWGAFHSVLGEFTPEQNALGWLAGFVIMWVTHFYRTSYKIEQEKAQLILTSLFETKDDRS